MSRNVKPGITFYRMDSGHIINKKVRLLYNEFQSDGYYIWSCLLDYAYGKWGYYFDMNDEEELELFASEFCRMKLSVIKEVINGCVRRGLFDKAVSDSFEVLTSAMMQEVFIYATADRRKKGSEFEMQEDWLKIQFDIVPGNIKILPGKNNKNPVNNTQTKQNQRQDNTKQEVSPAKPAIPVDDIEPYWQLLVDVWFDFGKEKFKEAPSFKGQDPRIFKKLIQLLKKRAASKNTEWTSVTGPQRLKFFLEAAFQDPWLGKHFLLSNLEKQFDQIIQHQSNASLKKVAPGATADVEYLYSRWLEDSLMVKLIQPEHYDELHEKNMCAITETTLRKRINQLYGTNKRKELELIQDYESGIETELTKEDLPQLKRTAVIELFNNFKTNGRTSIA